MRFYLKGFLYSSVIDPLLRGLQESVIERVNTSDTVLDVACGPGTMAMALAQKAKKVTGIDIEEELIEYAAGRASKRGLSNLFFRLQDASDLSLFGDDEFDIAVTSMAIHQFEPLLAIEVLKEMKRIAGTVVIADYNCPMPGGLSRSLAYFIEWTAGGDHYRNFRNYMSAGGVTHFTGIAGLTIDTSLVRGNGVLRVVTAGNRQ